MLSSVTAGIVSPGELGSAVGKLLNGLGVRVVTTLHGRSQRTARQAREAKLTVLDSLAEVVKRADIFISSVPPAGARAIADQYVELAELAPKDAIYVDINSIGPELVTSLAEKISTTHRRFVDASVHGQATNLAGGATLYLSGQVAEVSGLFSGAMRVVDLGPHSGRASAMKMLLGGLSKGMCALFLESAMLARRQEIVAEFNAEAKQFYPGLVSALERMLPTYPKHVIRRVSEMRQLEQTSLVAGQRPRIATAVADLLQELGRAELESSPDIRWTIASLVEKLAEYEFLAGDVPATQSGCV